MGRLRIHSSSDGLASLGSFLVVFYRYSPADEWGEKRIFLSSVAVGSYGIGKEGDKKVRRRHAVRPAVVSSAQSDAPDDGDSRAGPSPQPRGSFLSSTQQPPARDPRTPHILHDTSVDSVRDPSVFVVFHDTQALPGYVLVVADKAFCPACKQRLCVSPALDEQAGIASKCHPR